MTCQLNMLKGHMLENMQELFNMVQAVQQKAQEINDNMVRVIEFSHHIDSVIELYKDIFAQKKKTMVTTPHNNVPYAPNTFCRKSSCSLYATS